MKKYAVFSKVTIAPDDERVLLVLPVFRRAPRWQISLVNCLERKTGS